MSAIYTDYFTENSSKIIQHITKRGEGCSGFLGLLILKFAHKNRILFLLLSGEEMRSITFYSS